MRGDVRVVARMWKYSEGRMAGERGEVGGGGGYLCIINDTLYICEKVYVFFLNSHALLVHM